MTPEAVQIVREMIKQTDYRTTTMRAAASERRSAGDLNSEVYCLGLARESEAEAEALSSLLAVVEQIGWQDIATAPKDGREILILHPDHSVCISYWGSIRGVTGFKSKLHQSAGGGEGDFCRDATHWAHLPPLSSVASETRET